MKKFFLSLISICLLSLTIGCADETTIKTSAIVFTRPECSNTSKLLDFFKQLNANNNLITYQIKDLSMAENRILVQKFAQKHHITVKQLYTPIVFTPKGYSAGWGERTKEDLKLLLNIR